jgi:hypothetical protein
VNGESRVLLSEIELRVAELAAAATAVEAIAAALGLRRAEAAGLLETVYRSLGPARASRREGHLQGYISPEGAPHGIDQCPSR